MNTQFHRESHCSGEAFVSCSFQRLRNSAYWLLSIWIGLDNSHGGGGHLLSAMPQNLAVVDDFGNLVCVEGWK